ncbi:MAG: hypothetical protein Q8L57_00865 [bacterium]|nr:hypothetical protein [bacterium]
MKSILKTLCLILAVGFFIGGWISCSYFDFQIKFDEKISGRDLAAAKNLLEEWEKTRTFWFLKNIPRVKQDLAFKKGWVLAQTGAFEEAIKEFRKAAGHPSLGPEAIYNGATISLSGGRDSLEKLAEDYIRVLTLRPDDFQTKVNLEIIRILQNQAKKGMPQPGSGKEGKDKNKIKQYQMSDKEGQGQESGESNQGTRY